MSKEEFKMRAAVLVKGTLNLKCMLMIGDAFFKRVASAMVIHSTDRGRSLTMEK
jgi:hypothetical protein